jgi:TRAP transporter TAXI family solute receptor
MAVLRVSAIQLFVRDGAGIRSVSQFRGRRLSVGMAGGASDVAARVILKSYGLTPDDVHFLSHENLTMSDIAQSIRDKATDVGVVVTSVPVPTITDSPEELGIELVPLEPDKITWIRSHYPFYEPIVVPPRTYPGQRSETATIGIHGLLVCRDALPEELVYRLTKAFFDALPRLRATPTDARFIDIELSPATPIPLHAGAARFYRERELTQ